MNTNVSLDHATRVPSAGQTATVHTTEALVLSCMDFRMMDHVADFLERKGLRENYDMVTIAGGAIGVMNPEKPSWGETFWEHVDLARDLHGIRRIIVIDHRDCGACKAFVTSDCAVNRHNELEIHTKWLRDLSSEIAKRAPGLAVELYLMDLNGSAEEIEIVS
jgi:carbonic anhydrase